MMTTETTEETTTTDETEMPSAEWVKAVSDFLDTDPADLLAELGYYDRSEEALEVSGKN